MVIICNEKYRENNAYTHHFESYPYPLSDFQKYAIQGIVDGNHVLITAHTGSGKTLPAEFAIEYITGHNNKKKVIYTSPIKALSNQKFFEFTRKYPHISFGLMTGDIKTNPDADVVIMTTEILLNKVLNDTETMENLGCVIFDEVHYINDYERGQVWEKTILSLPSHIQMVMLSATIDNPIGFAKWCERGGSSEIEDGDKQVVLASTNHRIVPLTHYGFQTTTESIFKTIKDKAVAKQIRDTTNTLITIRDDKGKFYEDGYMTIQRNNDLFTKYQIRFHRKHVLNQMVGFLKEREMLPAIAFVFSRKNVELCANEITVPLLEFDSKVAYIVAKECEQIVRKLPNYKEYLELPEYKKLVALLEKGIGIHHSGMIPILREIVELMISKKYIKLLFATESFAIGLDCPIKTAIFTSVTKFDGSQERLLYSHEYTQMAGRAGRRGIDTIGHVIHCNNLYSSPSIMEYKKIVCGLPQKLVSKFRISYSLLLGCMKNGWMRTEEDFLEFTRKSMVQKEIDSELLSISNEIGTLQKKMEAREITLRSAKTPATICKNFIECNDAICKLTNKKRREKEREMEKIKDEYHTWKVDVENTKEYMEMENQMGKLKGEWSDLQHHHLLQIRKYMEILKVNGFIGTKEENLEITPLGSVASKIAEIHPLLSSSLIIGEWSWFSSFTVSHIIGFFSCFIDVRIQFEYRKINPVSSSGGDLFLSKKMEELQKMCEYYGASEEEKGVYSGIHYDDLIQFDMMELVMEWSSFQTEEECRVFLQTKLCEIGISIGDFIKGILKLVAITNEWILVCEEMGQIECKYKLSQIETLLLKYIATTQSLYV
jgi:superfamily II RNA helicase